ncbi:MAG: hypothetical protein ACRYGP_06330 [Janthinobacterium lividum]
MPLNPRPLHPAGHSHPGAEGEPNGFRTWSQHVGDPTVTTGQARSSQPLLPGIDLTHPLVKVAAVAFVGYTLGRLIHRHS